MKKISSIIIVFLISFVTLSGQFVRERSIENGTILARVADNETITGTWSFSNPIDSSLGTVSLPGYTFTGDTNTGTYSPGADQYAITIAGVQRSLWNITGLDVTGTVNISSLSASRLIGSDAGKDLVSIADLTTYVAGSGGVSILDDGDGTITVQNASGTSFVAGPASSTDNAAARWDGTSGGLLQDSLVIISDTGSLTVPNGQAIEIGTTAKIYELATEALFDFNLLGGGDQLSFRDQTTEVAAFGGGVISFALPAVIINSQNLGNNVAGTGYVASRNTSAGTEGPAAASILLQQANGTNRYYWSDAAGKLRVHTAAPTGSSGSPTVSDTAGTAFVGGPASSTANALARFNGTTGSLVQNSNAILANASYLHLNGATGEILRLDDTSATGNPFISFSQIGVRRTYLQHVDVGDTFVINSEFGGIQLYTANTQTMIVNRGTAYFFEAMRTANDTGSYARISNEGTGASSVGLFLRSSIGQLQLYGFGSGYTTSNQYMLSSALVESNSTNTNGLGVSVAHATAPIRFWTNSVERARINATGLGVGGVPDSLIHANTATAGKGAHLGDAFVGVWDATANYAVFTHFAIKGTTTSYALLQLNDGSTFLNAASGKVLSLRINNVDTLTMNATSVKANKLLHLNHSSDEMLRLDSTSATGNPYIGFSQAGGRKSYIQHNDTGDDLRIASEYGKLSLWTGTGGTEVEALSIEANGNVAVDSNTFFVDAASNEVRVRHTTDRYNVSLVSKGSILSSTGDSANESFVSMNSVAGLYVGVQAGGIGTGDATLGTTPDLKFVLGGGAFGVVMLGGSSTRGTIVMDEADANPTTSDLDANDSIAVYNKADKLVFAYNNGGTMTYITLPLNGSSTLWSHSTTAP